MGLSANLKRWVQHPYSLWVVFVLIAIVASVQGYMRLQKLVGNVVFTSYNNYLIFKHSFFHLIHHKDLYILYPQEHWDLYKYSPAFSLLFGIFAILPDWLGLMGWNLLNTLSLLCAINLLPNVSFSTKQYILLFVALELLTATQNAQSNALMAALLIFTFCYLERRQYGWATLCIVASIYIKLFGLVAFALFLFYPNKLRLVGYTLFWILTFALLPLLVVDAGQLQFLYQSWWKMLGNDHAASYGLSVLGWLHSWFGYALSKSIPTLAGVFIFCLPLMYIRRYQQFFFRLLMCCSILLWVVIFNHKAESPTFIIAMCGVGIWYFTQPRSALNTALVVSAFIFTSLSPTDLFPKILRENLVVPYVLKGVACIAVWCKIIFDLLSENYKISTSKNT